MVMEYNASIITVIHHAHPATPVQQDKIRQDKISQDKVLSDMTTDQDNLHMRMK